MPWVFKDDEDMNKFMSELKEICLEEDKLRKERDEIQERWKVIQNELGKCDKKKRQFRLICNNMTVDKAEKDRQERENMDRRMCIQSL